MMMTSTDRHCKDCAYYNLILMILVVCDKYNDKNYNNKKEKRGKKVHGNKPEHPLYYCKLF